MTPENWPFWWPPTTTRVVGAVQTRVEDFRIFFEAVDPFGVRTVGFIEARDSVGHSHTEETTQ